MWLPARHNTGFISGDHARGSVRTLSRMITCSAETFGSVLQKFKKSLQNVEWIFSQLAQT